MKKERFDEDVCWGGGTSEEKKEEKEWYGRRYNFFLNILIL